MKLPRVKFHKPTKSADQSRASRNALTIEEQYRLRMARRNALIAKTREAIPPLPVLLGGLLLVALLFLFVFPTSTYLAKKKGVSAAQDQLEKLREERLELAAQVDRLENSDEIERIARERFNLVKPGERAYSVLPAPTPTTTVPPKS